MCGLAGFCDFTLTSGKDILSGMIDTLNHRGPDGTGENFWSFSNFNLGLAHKRLSIIDLSDAAKQPMLSEDNKIAIAFNGEIYNYKEIKTELIAHGFSFKTNSDTEVILNAYLKWGTACVQKFIGMFAIVLVDQVSNQLYIIRDRAGVKPLFYYYKDGLFLFSSELKAFHQHPGFKKEINQSAIAHFFKRGWIPGPSTIFNYTFKLAPGHILELDLNTKAVKIEKYWDVIDLYNQEKLNLPMDEVISETEKILHSAFNYRMVSDVPVGVFLSGGFDSSTLAAILQKDRTEKIKTYTIGFENKELDEAREAKKIAEHLGTDHFEYYCDIDDALKLIDRLPYFYDEPFADNSAIPTMLVSKMAAEHVKVVLSADGGDELFGGYPKYYLNNPYYELIRKTPKWLRTSLSTLTYSFDPGNKISTLLRSKNGMDIYRHKIEQTHFTQNEIKKLLKNTSVFGQSVYDDFGKLNSEIDPVNAMLCIDYKAFMCDDVLQKVDRASMSFSIESREHFLDQRIL